MENTENRVAALSRDRGKIAVLHHRDDTLDINVVLAVIVITPTVMTTNCRNTNNRLSQTHSTHSSKYYTRTGRNYSKLHLYSTPMVSNIGHT